MHGDHRWPLSLALSLSHSLTVYIYILRSLPLPPVPLFPSRANNRANKSCPSHSCPSHSCPSHCPSHSCPGQPCPSNSSPSHSCPSHPCPSHPCLSHLAVPTNIRDVSSGSFAPPKIRVIYIDVIQPCQQLSESPMLGPPAQPRLPRRLPIHTLRCPLHTHALAFESACKAATGRPLSSPPPLSPSRAPVRLPWESKTYMLFCCD